MMGLIKPYSVLSHIFFRFRPFRISERAAGGKSDACEIRSWGELSNRLIDSASKRFHSCREGAVRVEPSARSPAIYMVRMPDFFLDDRENRRIPIPRRETSKLYVSDFVKVWVRFVKFLWICDGLHMDCVSFL
jgi:hypothetical protein